MSVVFVDVDGTLLHWPGRKGRVPRRGEPDHGKPPRVNWSLVKKLRELHAEGYRLVVWSTGGAAHARMAVEAAELADVVDVCLEKPGTVVDDGDPFKRATTLTAEELCG